MTTYVEHLAEIDVIGCVAVKWTQCCPLGSVMVELMSWG